MSSYSIHYHSEAFCTKILKMSNMLYYLQVFKSRYTLVCRALGHLTVYCSQCLAWQQLPIGV